ncbi:hypothetical protein [Streptomyces sp. MA25(2023)]|uniref:hypothetical protein n=1 Tax=Streptomyces sp. MA25(2023) TaxID=3055078 RepID=UPI0025B04932|nr:hypothetical protein [Streptomyces sp. MA25(2023)]MDN3252234.1 hypothetical protein [Streptomyces sp. MA25(2023)]
MAAPVVSGALTPIRGAAEHRLPHKHGGVHADVDLGIGQVKLHEDVPPLSVGDVPVLGPQLRDRSRS